MFISAGSRKCSRKSRKRERQRRLQKLNQRKRNPPRRKQRNKMEKFLAAFLGALIAFVWSAIANQNLYGLLCGPFGAEGFNLGFGDVAAEGVGDWVNWGNWVN